MWPAVFGLIGCVAVYLAGRRLFGRRVGLISCMILATSSFWYVMSHVINLDMAVSSLLTCALLSFLVGIEEKTAAGHRGWMWAFYLFSALATLTKGLIGVVIPAMVIGSWMLIVRDWKLLKNFHVTSGALIFFVVAAPWHILISREFPDFLRSYLFEEHLQRYLTKPQGPFEQPWAYVPVLLLGLIPWSVFMVQAIIYNMRYPWRQPRRPRKIIFLILWPALVFIFFSGSSYKGAPYILPVFPPLALLIGRYLAGAWETGELSGIRAGCGALLVVLILLVIVGLNGPQSFLERYSNWPATEAPGEGTVASSVSDVGDLSGLTPYIRLQTVILLLGCVPVILLGLRRGNAFRRGILSLTLIWGLFLLAFNSSLPVLDERRSVKALATLLKSNLQPADEVASFHAYYQDLPVYLQRPVAVVGWRGNLQYGVEVNEHSGGWMIDDASFWKRWNGPATVYMITEQTTYRKLSSEKSFRPRVVARGIYDIVLSNKPA
jgi:4-amino-4-deoxy-L-arabinose transferase-like glycosyltransferase